MDLLAVYIAYIIVATIVLTISSAVHSKALNNGAYDIRTKTYTNSKYGWVQFSLNVVGVVASLLAAIATIGLILDMTAK